ncbi:flagellar hook capping FlgD N-terminal domain-containing protein [Cellulomonas sp. ES6]|uniref:flagellar hook assembly protein FlgD n=1 Tax=Cellulomonas sp. ES6 TaxID=3039384 RepID=UPI0024B7C6DC|nr:flagellar hook capping FlgD N-terminal domain-containing protein [Cellulomonas sp. ES6]WHP19029.1 flagellar hook capping FlgD N-terminal domain-containing protein [Cellulomonas sp. ES6]
MSIDVSYITNQSAAATESTSTPSKTLDKDTFLKLLVAQLSNQDPSSPMDTSDMMAQTTQLSMMESLSEIQASAREQFALQMRMASADLVGKQVTWTDADGTTQTGVVGSVDYSATVPVLQVGETKLPLDAVAGISPVPATTPTTTA